MSVDACGLMCPMPVIRLKKAMDGLSSGEVVELKATDKGTCKDIPNWVKQTRHELVDTKEETGIFFYYVRKRDA